jgi:predicted HAD superfamily Cof-like phosphohydrolase
MFEHPYKYEIENLELRSDQLEVNENIELYKALIKEEYEMIDSVEKLDEMV